jgi:hypothetical protein
MIAVERSPAKARRADRLRKITVEIPQDDLAAAQAYTRAGVTETVREGIRRLAQTHIQNEFRKRRGKVRLSLTLADLKYDD